MKITFRLIASLMIALLLVVSVFTYIRTRAEEKKLDEDLSLRVTVLAKSFQGAIENFLESTDQPDRIRKFITKFAGHTRLVGIMVDLREGGFVTLPDELAQQNLFKSELEKVIETAEPFQLNGIWGTRQINFYALPLTKDDKVVGSLGLIHDRSYIVNRIREFLKETAITFSILALLLSVTTLIIIRINITGPVNKLARWLSKSHLSEESPSQIEALKKMSEVERLTYEVTHVATSLKKARMELTKQGNGKSPLDLIWTKEILKNYLKEKLSGKPLFVVANREPYMHQKKNGKIECIVPASGVVTALDPVLQVTGGLWLAHGSGDADREVVDKKDKVRVPPWNPSYTLKRVWISEEEEKGYYYGFANEGFWPLCHISHTRPVFRAGDWEQYQKVNQKFADSLLKELTDDAPMILVQDYHFALLPSMIKKKRPDAKIALFWHIPWPNPEAYGICPWQKEILEGMLGSDLIGFHTQFHCNNFLETVDRYLESRIDWTVFGVERGGHKSYVKPFPISIATFQGKEDPSDPEESARLKETYGLQNKILGVGVDRIDYTKGLLERFRSIDRFLEKYSSYKEKFVFVELGAPSRTLIGSYQQHMAEIESLVGSINQKYETQNWKPILFLKEHHGHEIIKQFYKTADFCLVTSLHDGMNLVAKEYVSERFDNQGVLILSHFAGASYQMKSALLVNPYDIEETAEAIHQALTMSKEEKEERMKQLRTLVQEHNIYRWAAELVTELVKTF